MNQVIQIIRRLAILIIWGIAFYLVIRDFRIFDFVNAPYFAAGYLLTLLGIAIVLTFAMKWVFSTKEPKQPE